MSISYRNYNEPPKEILPRGDKDDLIKVEYPNNNNNMVKNIILIASTGVKVSIKIPFNKKVYELFRMYVRKLGIGEGVLGTQIYFVYDARHLDVNDQRLIKDVFKSNEHNTVIVIDQNNVIGA